MSSATKTSKIEINGAASREQLEQVRGLLLEYGQSLGFSLCFQSFIRSWRSCPVCMLLRLAKTLSVWF
jgi:hypothetical protein